MNQTEYDSISSQTEFYSWIGRKIPEYVQSICQNSRGRISFFISDLEFPDQAGDFDGETILKNIPWKKIGFLTFLILKIFK